MQGFMVSGMSSDMPTLSNVRAVQITAEWPRARPLPCLPPLSAPRVLCYGTLMPVVCCPLGARAREAQATASKSQSGVAIILPPLKSTTYAATAAGSRNYAISHHVGTQQQQRTATDSNRHRATTDSNGQQRTATDTRYYRRTTRTHAHTALTGLQSSRAKQSANDACQAIIGARSGTRLCQRACSSCCQSGIVQFVKQRTKISLRI